MSEIKAGYPCTDEELMEAAVESELIKEMLESGNAFLNALARGFMAGICFRSIDEIDRKHGVELDGYMALLSLEACINELEGCSRCNS